MEEKKEIALIGHYFQLVLRKRWFVIVPFCLAMAIGFAWANRAPKIYEAKTLILVEPQAVPGDVVRPIVSRDMSSRIATINQQITSRSNLEKIIGQFQLFAKPEQQKLFMEDKLESLRKRIMVNVTQTRAPAGAFSIAFQASDAEQTMKVANALSSLFH